ncbi:mechanosensitive ion channel family protein [Pseudoruegeria sp. SK021]|uniref:mechanosensitive ion channel family protein n=1 Tax=Pseudoruegeria sp. SK021 TaxID=1933035 RepID=UPI000A23C2E0|nr:mechanosensitive ion channel family protein [Pseudoruegeria sp. SK021]OSP56470.1 small conductance mechanosensitive channel [Pseudoruegeria sp. SK021]
MTFSPRYAVSAALLALFLCVAWALPSFAQDADAPEVAAATDVPVEETAPAYPAGLDNPEIPVSELTLRVIPLTTDELTALADSWLMIVKEQTTDVVEQQLVIPTLSGSEADAAREVLTGLSDQRGQAFDRYTTVVDNLAKKGGDEAKVASYRAYRNAIVVDEKQNADWQTLYKMAVSWTLSRDGGIELGLRIAVIVGSFIALMALAGIVRRVARRFFGRVPDLSKLLQGFLAMLVYWVVIAFGLMIVLSSLGIDITPVFALVGGASFIIAFAFQETLSNLAAGLMIMVNRPFDEGDYVTVAGTGGTVKAVSIVSTTVTTPDNQIIVIPNSKVWGDVITNVTASATRRVDMVFGISYEDSIADAQKILEEVVAMHPLVLEDPAPTIRVDELADSSVNFICRPWSTTSNYWAVKWDLTRQVKEAFDKAGISIPYPQADFHVHMKQDGAVFPGAEPAALTAPTPTAPTPAAAATGGTRSQTAAAIARGEDGDGESENEDRGD